jgi:LVIVD repeat
MRLVLLVISYLALLVTGCMDESLDANSTGTGGSLTRFAIRDSHLYVASSSTISVYSIGANTFSFVKDVSVGFQLETIFANGEVLYLGARDAMYIYSISDRSTPTLLFKYGHIVSCDPVVVQGNLAYVTLKSGIGCNRGGAPALDILEIIDISNPNRPLPLATYPMTSPGGLAIDGSCLFVCEGANGMKMLNVANPLDIKVVNQLTIDAYDVIARNGLLTLTGEDGVYQFQYDCAMKSLLQLSKIPVQREEL